MRLWIILAIIGGLLGGIARPSTSEAAFFRSPADLLPASNWFYAQMDSPLPPNMLGDQWAISLFAFEDAPLIPNVAWILEFDLITPLMQLTDSLTSTGQWEAESHGSSITLYARQDFPIPYGFLVIDQQYMVFSETGTLEELVKRLILYPDYETLATLPAFEKMQADFLTTPAIWGYSGLTQMGAALYPESDLLGVDVFWQDNPSATSAPVARPFDGQVLEAVPITTLGLVGGMDLNLWLQRMVDGLRSMTQWIGSLNENFSNLSPQLEALLRVALGINVEQDLIPLFEGSSVMYITRTQATVGGWPLGVEGGLILAPDEPRNAIITLTRLGNRLGQNLGFTPELTDTAQFTIHSPIEPMIPDSVYGVAQNRYVYWSSASGASAIQLTAEGDNSLATSQVWQQALSVAPDGFQNVAYLNLASLGDSAAVLLPVALPVESAALYHRQDQDGFGMLRLVVMLRQ